MKWLKKIKWYIVLMIAFVVLTAISVYTMCNNSNQASAPVGLDVGFEGKYSYDEKNWYDIGEKKMSGTHDSVVLKGKFVAEFSEQVELLLNMFSSHIIIEIFEDDFIQCILIQMVLHILFALDVLAGKCDNVPKAIFAIAISNGAESLR